ncbi:MAG: hypothetical protein AUJ92_15665 [Armatimonadetes bacterium CG2_30_59_28]|nr:MAG: hypothetical protein AUJ92_15665 [Armatimonadetes bacterium CG2_30_59_28]
MGERYGATFRDEISDCMNRFCPWLGAPSEKLTHTLNELRSSLACSAPELLEETEGMARGVEVAEAKMLAYRFFPDVRNSVATGCSNVFLAHSNTGPLLGRNNDIENDFSQEIQVCHVRRPEGGFASITTTYVGLVAVAGMNEHGLGVGGSSAPTTAARSSSGLPGAALQWLAIHRCRSVPDVVDLFARHTYSGKPCNLLVADASETSHLFECIPGLPPQRHTSLDPAKWNACTNTFLSGRFPTPENPDYQQSSYARYGRIVHQLREGLVDHTLAGLQNLLRDIAMPGPFCTGFDGRWKTAYSQVMCLRERKMHLSPGHPSEVPWEVISL